METKIFSTIRLLVLSLFMLLPLQIYATGFIIIDPFFPRPQIPAQLTIKNHDIKVSINKQITTTRITQVFHNPNNYDLEGTYNFPVPENICFNNFTMYVNEKPLAAKILDKHKAFEIYKIM